MPPSAHDFALKDMEFNRSEYFTLLKNQPGMNKSAFLFSQDVNSAVPILNM